MLKTKHTNVFPNRELGCVCALSAVYLIVRGFVGWSQPSSWVSSWALPVYSLCSAYSKEKQLQDFWRWFANAEQQQQQNLPEQIKTQKSV